MKKKYKVYGIQGHHYEAEIEANTVKEAIKLAQNNHENYEWKNTDYVDDWKYEA